MATANICLPHRAQHHGSAAPRSPPAPATPCPALPVPALTLLGGQRVLLLRVGFLQLLLVEFLHLREVRFVAHLACETPQLAQRGYEGRERGGGQAGRRSGQGPPGRRRQRQPTPGRRPPLPAADNSAGRGRPPPRAPLRSPPPRAPLRTQRDPHPPPAPHLWVPQPSPAGTPRSPPEHPAEPPRAPSRRLRCSPSPPSPGTVRPRPCPRCPVPAVPGAAAAAAPLPRSAAAQVRLERAAWGGALYTPAAAQPARPLAARRGAEPHGKCSPPACSRRWCEAARELRFPACLAARYRGASV